MFCSGCEQEACLSKVMLRAVRPTVPQCAHWLLLLHCLGFEQRHGVEVMESLVEEKLELQNVLDDVAFFHLAHRGRLQWNALAVMVDK